MALGRYVVIPALAAAALAAGLAVATAQEGRGRLKLHEDIVAPEDTEDVPSARVSADSPVIGDEPTANQNPAAIASQDKLIPEPPADERPNAEEPVHGRGGFGADRQTESRPDRATEADSTLHYTEVFNPSIVPFKRMSALNAIRSDYTLEIEPGVLSDLPVGGSATEGFDLFWGSILVELQPGRDVPIPSVAPEMRVLSYETTPHTEVTFSKDAADNYYLRSDESDAKGTYRVVFLVEASPHYFAPKPPASYAVRNIPQDLVASVPANILPQAERALRTLGLSKNSRADDALAKLVYYFRGFEAGEDLPNSGDVYWDLFTSKTGVCRHRSFAFMITASALGLPTRFLSNEAHAWVEVWLPGRDWMRIDLGGAASALNVANASDKSMYRPRGDDPFESPSNYEENYTRLEGDVNGLRDEQIAERQKPYEAEDGSAEGNGSFFGEDEGEQGDLETAKREAQEEERRPLVGPGSDLPSVPEEDKEGKEPVMLTILELGSVGYRGEAFRLLGEATGLEGQPLEGLTLNVFLAPAGREGNNPTMVGRGVTDKQGRVSLQLEVPAALETREHEVYISFDGNRTLQPALSD